MACILENIVFYRVLLRLHTTYHSIYSNHEWSPLETYVWWFPVDGDHILSVNPQNHQTLQLFGWFPPFMFSSMQFWFSQHVVSSFVFLNIWYRSVVGVLYHLFQITRAFILIVIIDQSLLSLVEAESNPKQRAVWQGPAVALCLPSPSFVLPPPGRNIGKHAGAHGCEFLMVHALSGFCSAQSKFLCDVCQEYRSQKTLRKPPASLGQGKMLLMDDFDSVVLPPKTWNPDLVYSNLAGWISYDMFSQPFFLWFSQIHPLKCWNLEGIYPWWSRECQVQPKMCRMLRGCCGLGSGCNLTLKAHPWKLTWNLKTPNWNGKSSSKPPFLGSSR